jgi:hypothetical protein
MNLLSQQTKEISMFIAAVFTTAKLCNQARYPETGMNKENVVYIHNGVLFSHREE